jgi:protein-S-isoprenylcysteine O-methyltransferase Ste14
MDLQREDHAAPVTSAPGRQFKLALDVGERLFSVALFSFMVSGFIKAGLTVGTVPALLSEGIVVTLMVTRRPTDDISLRPWDWLIGLAGVAAPMLARPAHVPAVLSPAVCGVAILCGLVVSVWGKVTLARGFGLVAANRGVVQRGPYRLVRHPIYSGYIISFLAFMLGYPSLRNVAVELGAIALIVVRVIAEERVLSADPVYRAFKADVRYRLIPGVY